ncbi:hypothetical protein SAMN05216349_11133 [Oribacterium sp. KHPX15]|nr:hypothetical protein SAMN05216349_11133 [Oribacterium sp. KHPX15]
MQDGVSAVGFHQITSWLNIKKETYLKTNTKQKKCAEIM